MTTWTLTTESSGDHTQHASGEADDHAEAAAALVTAAHDHIAGTSVPARYTFDIDGEVIAVLVSNDDGDGRSDRAATLELLDRINLPWSLSRTTTTAAPWTSDGTEIRPSL